MDGLAGVGNTDRKSTQEIFYIYIFPTATRSPFFGVILSRENRKAEKVKKEIDKTAV